MSDHEETPTTSKNAASKRKRPRKENNTTKKINFILLEKEIGNVVPLNAESFGKVLDLINEKTNAKITSIDGEKVFNVIVAVVKKLEVCGRHSILWGLSQENVESFLLAIGPRELSKAKIDATPTQVRKFLEPRLKHYEDKSKRPLYTYAGFLYFLIEKAYEAFKKEDAPDVLPKVREFLSVFYQYTSAYLKVDWVEMKKQNLEISKNISYEEIKSEREITLLYSGKQENMFINYYTLHNGYQVNFGLEPNLQSIREKLKNLREIPELAPMYEKGTEEFEIKLQILANVSPSEDIYQFTSTKSLEQSGEKLKMMLMRTSDYRKKIQSNLKNFLETAPALVAKNGVVADKREYIDVNSDSGVAVSTDNLVGLTDDLDYHKMTASEKFDVVIASTQASLTNQSNPMTYETQKNLSTDGAQKNPITTNETEPDPTTKDAQPNHDVHEKVLDVYDDLDYDDFDNEN